MQKTSAFFNRFNKYLKNTGWLVSEKLFRMFTGVAVGVWIVRYLGPEQYGLLTYSQSYVALFSAIATLGLEGVVVRSLVKDCKAENTLLGTTFVLKISSAILLFPVLICTTILSGEDTQTTVLILIIASSILLQAFNVLDYNFQAKCNGNFIAYANSISLGVSSLVKIMLILSGAELVAFAITSIFDAAILAASYLWFYSKSGGKIKAWTFNLATAKSLLLDSWPLIFSFLFTTISLRIDQIIIKNHVGVDAVGYYSASLRLIEVFYFIPVVITTTVFPKLVDIRAEKYYERKVQALSVVLTYIAIIIIIGCLLAGDNLIALLYGDKYKFTADLFIYHAMSILFIYNYSLRKKLLLIDNANVYVMIYSAVTAVIMVLSILLLVQVNGTVGAAQGYAVAWCASILLTPLLLGRPNEVLFFIKSFNPIYLLRELK